MSGIRLLASLRSSCPARAAWLAPLLAGLLAAGPLQAQQPTPPAAQVQKSEPALAPPGAEVKPPAPAPSWQQGRSSAQGKSTLHPFAPILTGRPASELPIDKLKLPPGF